MKNKINRKFVFTQISALPIAFGGVFSSLYILREFNLIENFKDIKDIVIFIVAFLSGIFIPWKLWSVLLVKVNVLTKEEARGYPYARPWESKGNTTK